MLSAAFGRSIRNQQTSTTNEIKKTNTNRKKSECNKQTAISKTKTPDQLIPIVLVWLELPQLATCMATYAFCTTEPVVQTVVYYRLVCSSASESFSRCIFTCRSAEPCSLYTLAADTKWVLLAPSGWPLVLWMKSVEAYKDCRKKNRLNLKSVFRPFKRLN